LKRSRRRALKNPCHLSNRIQETFRKRFLAVFSGMAEAVQATQVAVFSKHQAAVFHSPSRLQSTKRMETKKKHIPALRLGNAGM
jgi:hypothetical protein